MVHGLRRARILLPSLTAISVFRGASWTTRPSLASLVVIGYVEQTKQDHAADIFEAIQAGVLNWSRICQLGEILTGARTGRTGPEDITVFKNNGLAVEFVSLAAKAFEIARAQGRGEEIPEHYFSGLRSPAKS